MSDPLVAQVWPVIDLDKWDRPGPLVWLVGQLSSPPCPAPIDPEVIRIGLERSPEQAKYDHRVMVRLAERDRVLIRWPGRGRRPDAWLINPDLTRWRNVPWVPSRAAVLRLFSGPEFRNCVPLWGERAGQSLWMRGDRPLAEPVQPSNRTLGVRPSTAHDHPTTARPTLKSEARSPHNGTPVEAAFPYRSESENHSLTTSPNEEGVRECVEQSQTDGGAVLLAAVRSAVKANTHVGGRFADRLREIGRDHPEHLEALVYFSNGMGWVKTAVETVRQIEGELERLTHAPRTPEPARPDPAARLATVRRLMAAYDPDDPQLAELLAEAEQMEAAIGDSVGSSI